MRCGTQAMKDQERILAKVHEEHLPTICQCISSALIPVQTKAETAVSHVSVPCSSKTAQQHCAVSTALHSISSGLGYEMSHVVGVIARGSTS